MTVPARRPVPPFASMNPQQQRAVHAVLFDRPPEDILPDMENKPIVGMPDELKEALKGALILALVLGASGIGIGWTGHAIYRRRLARKLLAL